jgi:predicted transcriptional regulator YheO
MESELIFKTYMQLVPFLETVLGRQAEIVLHDLRKAQDTIIAMGGTSFTGRKTGDTLSALGKELSSLADVQPYTSGNREATPQGRELRTNTFFIKDSNQQLIGLLCIHMDISIPLQAMEYLSAVIGQGGRRFNDGDADLTDRVESLADRMIEEALEQFPVPVSRMTSKEKHAVIQRLCEQSVFRIKGSVSKVALRLGLSEPTVYRYLKDLSQS